MKELDNLAVSCNKVGGEKKIQGETKIVKGKTCLTVNWEQHRERPQLHDLSRGKAGTGDKNYGNYMCLIANSFHTIGEHTNQVKAT